jgi:hypothetical protein
VTVLVGFALVGIGSWANHGAKDIDSRLKKLSGRKAGWNEPTNLAGWMPRSSAQLHAVEEIADSHDGVAFVRDVGTRIAEVYAKAGTRFERYWVHESGDAELLEQRLGGRFTIGDQHVKRLRNDGLPWHTIRTWIEENDGG